MADKKSAILSISEYKCAICLELLVEPVVLPCKHEMCRPCFRNNVEKANFLCPICRKRIASWTRKCMREGTLVDQNRWNLIQKLFPKKCLRRLQGDDDESEDEVYQPPPKRVLAKSGELRQEYEQELNKILHVREQEDKASQDLIKKILEEEQELQLKQERADQQLARKLSGDFEQTQNKEEESLNKSNTGDNSPETNRSLKKRKSSTKGRRSYTIDKYFSSKGKEPGSSSNDPNNNVLQHKSDYDLALALQKQFDHETVSACERDEYMLRKSTLGTNHRKHPQKNPQSKSNKQKNGHSCMSGEQARNKMLQGDGEKTPADEKESMVGNRHIQNMKTWKLRDRTIFNGTTM